jgi:hypothetical protein
MAIQRATHVPKTCMIKFVVDRTFKVDPQNAGGTTTPATSIMNIKCNDIITPIDMVNNSGTWSCQFGAGGASAEGVDDWLKTGDGRYQNYAVLGNKIQATILPAAASIPPSYVGDPAAYTATQAYINNYAVGIHKCTNGLTDITQTTTLPEIQKMPYTRLRNMRGNVDQASGMQGASISDTYSAKKWEGVSDVKDVDKLKGNYTTPPVEGGKYQLFIATREPLTLTHQHPPVLLRLKIEYVVLLSDPLTSDNTPMIVKK